jgi:hypothetical protein
MRGVQRSDHGRGRWFRFALVAVGLLVGMGIVIPVWGAQGDVVRVSVATGGTQANADVFDPVLSGDGRFVAFSSDATNLVSGDSNGVTDAFVHDTQTGETTRASVSGNGTEGNGMMVSRPAISANGRYVVFASQATNLVPGDTNGVTDAFIRDIQTGQTFRTSLDSNGTQGDDASFSSAITPNGRYITVRSSASNLVAGDTNFRQDVFVRDRQTGTMTRASVDSNGTESDNHSFESAISDDGRYVAFESFATNLVSGDTNGEMDVFVHDIQTEQTTRVSVRSNGAQGNGASAAPAISGDGRYVVFESQAPNLVSGDTNGTTDVFVHDRQTGMTSRVSVAADGTQGNAFSFTSSISGNGRYVAYVSNSTNLVAGDTNNAVDVFVRDLQIGSTSRVSLAAGGAQSNGGAFNTALSVDGRYVAFDSSATNLVSGDSNAFIDVFVAQFLPDPGPPPPPPPPVTDWFVDDNGHTFEGDINAIATAGITKGCNPPANDRYCPDDEMTRGQLAAFLTRLLKLEVPDQNPFTDTSGHTFERDIAALAAAGITKGCNPPANDRYCPDDEMTRGQLAAFLTRLLKLEVPDQNPFTDTSGHTFERDIAALAAAGITKGCNPPANDRYCPDDSVTRGQMAAFTNRTFLK